MDELALRARWFTLDFISAFFIYISFQYILFFHNLFITKWRDLEREHL